LRTRNENGLSQNEIKKEADKVGDYDGNRGPGDGIHASPPGISVDITCKENICSFQCPKKQTKLKGQNESVLVVVDEQSMESRRDHDQGRCRKNPGGPRDKSPARPSMASRIRDAPREGNNQKIKTPKWSDDPAIFAYPLTQEAALQAAEDPNPVSASAATPATSVRKR
jgi:hypothetical protein